MNTRIVPPNACSMLESLRGLGYSTADALADIIDNCISACATEVKIDFFWVEKEAPYITILDNGTGMDDPSLEAAMRLGDRNPLDHRTEDDLGRFGLGLKTASFSQCRSLTVASLKKSGTVTCLRWDLDDIAARNDGLWTLLEGQSIESKVDISILDDNEHGTLVIWEKLDRLIPLGSTKDDYLKIIDLVEMHLAMVFHRLIDGPNKKIDLYINHSKIPPWDPFLIGHPGKTWNSPVEKIKSRAGVVEVECHVLPHKDKLSNEKFIIAGGPDGWNAQQGFYVYRNNRLLLAGGWLGLGHGRAWQREEAQTLARIRLDIPNTADLDWDIDIRKATARIPVYLRPRLTSLAEDTRRRARQVFVYRGKPSVLGSKAKVEQAWLSENLKAGMKYKVDTNHPAVSAVLESAGNLLPQIKAMLRVIEETVPVQKIWLDTADNKEPPVTSFVNVPPHEVSEILEVLYLDMIGRKNMSIALAKQTLLKTEPFHKYPELIDKLPEAA